MKKNFLTVIALMVAAFFVATEIAQAADVSFSGQLRTRYEVNEQGGNNANDFDDETDTADFIGARVRLNTSVNINDSTSAFIQMQSVRTWGGGVPAIGANGSGLGTAGSQDASFQASNGDDSVGLHQAYFTLKNFASLPVDLKVGRQQVVLDGHRLYGHTGWTTGAQTHDGLRMTHKHDNMTLAYFWIVAAESGVPAGTAAANGDDIENHVLHFSYKGILGGTMSVLYSWLDDPCGTNTNCTLANSGDNSINTIGFRQAGQLYGIDYRGEYYHQFGQADIDITELVGTGVTATTATDRNAYMFGVRIGKTFKNVSMKPSLTIWYDYLSGTSDEDLNRDATVPATDAEYKSFNTLFDTGHKFYGFMDLYLGVGGGGSGNGTEGLGLQDLAIKTKFHPMPGWTLKADYHWFWTAEGPQASPSRGLDGNDGGHPGTGHDSDLGNELDITLINKYNANTNISVGFSNYTTSGLFRQLRGVVGDASNWAYVMFDVKF